MTFKKIMEREEKVLGRPITLLDKSLIKTNGMTVRIVLYKCKPVELSRRSATTTEPTRIQFQHEIRSALYVDDYMVSGTILKLWSKWYRKKAEHGA